MGAKISQDEANENVNRICKEINFTYEPFKYIGSLNTKLILRCPNGHELQNTTYSKFISKNGIKCRKCMGCEKKSQEDAEKEIHNICLENEYTFKPFVYIGTDETFITFTCKHNHTWNTTSFYHFTKRGHRCPFCSPRCRYTQKEAELLVNVRLNEYEYKCEPFTYIGVDKTFLHLTCNKGHKWSSTSFYNFTKYGTKCPECQSTESYKLKEIIDPLLPEFEKEKRFDDCRLIRPLPFDRYVPSLNLLIEYDGEQHFKYIEYIHGNIESYNKMIERDKIKTKYAIDNGFNFIRIAYFEDCGKSINSIIEYCKKFKQCVIIHGSIIF